MGSGSSAVSSTAKLRRRREVITQKESAQKNREIDKCLMEDKNRMLKTVKLLLLGAGESGKSTFAKQIRLIHHAGFNDNERLAYKQVIYSNLISSLRNIIDAMSTLGIDYHDSKRRKDESCFRCQAELFDMDADVTLPMAHNIMELWRDPGVAQCYNRSNEYQLIDSTAYYIENVYRLADPDYLPTDEDIIRSRLRTTGIIETRFNFKGYIFRLLDVGGQRNERQKWIHCFDDVTAVLFTVAISSYDQVLREDNATSRMEESLMLFASICNSSWFSKTAMILFLNKCDIFKEKIKKVPLSCFFREYKGPNDAKPAREFICSAFKRLSKLKSREIYHHFTTAIDKSNVQFVFDAVTDVILKSSLRNAGMF
ncbi:guanine nucleotide-binding protein G(t) subunit alpha-3-like [Asterias amurensis]|uniref:guanine nucleotide-binding protein G(t) subunit alpha-3-like n=1 Tax=Asterias amurensis TaxID=7602 RepID=UPI003AB64044